MFRKLAFGLISLGLVGCASDEGAGAAPSSGGAGSGGAVPSGGSGGSTPSGGTAGEAGGGGEAGAAGSAGSAGGAPDYAAASWTNENVSNTPGTITHDGRLVFIGSKEFFAWSEPDAIDINDQDIYAGIRTAMKPVTNDTKVQNAFPALAVADGAPALVYNGYPDGDNDLYWAIGELSSPINLTEASEATSPREDFAPALSILENGGRAIAYLSAPPEFAGEIEVRTLEWNGNPSALQPKSVISGKGGCDDPALVSDPAGHLHVLSACGPLFKESVYYATNASGTWEAKQLATTTGDSSTRLAITPDGKTLFALWLNESGNLVLVSSEVGDKWSEPAVAVVNGYSPVLAADAAGRALIAFHRDNAQKKTDVFFTWSQGAGFYQPVLLTPNSNGTTEWMPSAIVLEPDTGYPHVLYGGLEAGSDPLNSDVWRAKLVPSH